MDPIRELIKRKIDQTREKNEQSCLEIQKALIALNEQNGNSIDETAISKVVEDHRQFMSDCLHDLSSELFASFSTHVSKITQDCRMYVSALKTNDSFFAYNINKLVNEWKDENEAINANSMTHLKDNSGQMDTDDEPIFESPGNDVLVYRCIQSDTTESGRSFEELELLFSDIPTDELQQIVDALCEQGRCHTTCDMKHFKCPDG